MYHVSPECDCEFQLKIPHRLFVYSFENAYFCLFKYKWAAAPAAPAPPSSARGQCLYSSYLGYSAKNNGFVFDYHVYCTENMHFKAISV